MHKPNRAMTGGHSSVSPQEGAQGEVIPPFLLSLMGRGKSGFSP